MRSRAIFFLLLLATSAVAATQPVPIAGAPVDVSQFAYARRLLNVRSGLNIVTLDAAALAHSRIDDLRVVDAAGRQVPYVIEQKPTILEIRLSRPALVEGSTPHESRYALRLPLSTLPQGELFLTTNAGVFDRNVSVEKKAHRGRSPQVIATAAWRSVSGKPEPLTITLPANAGRELVLLVDEGDNSRLPITGAELKVPTRSIRFFASDPRLRLLYGNTSVGSPRYDIALLGSEIDSSAANVARLAPESASSHGGGGDSGVPTFWIALIASVAVLLVLLVRLIAAEGGRSVQS